MAAGQAINTPAIQRPGPDLRMLVLPGPSAFSSFRLASLISNINKAVNSNAVTAIRTAYVHYVALRSPDSEVNVEASEKRKLVDALLKYDEPLDQADPLNALLVNVIANDSISETDAHLVRIIPRPGTISPWSSKATNIFQVCGLDSDVERVERGLAILICVRKGFPLDMYLKDEVVLNHLHDRMTQLVLQRAPTYDDLFVHHSPRPLVTIDLSKSPKDRLEEANQKFGLALSQGEIQYLADAFLASNRNPTDVELFMFAQVNSEHCRHKIFNADWKIDGEQKPLSLFKMIRNTEDKAGEFTVSAYSDNAAVLSGPPASFFAPLFDTGAWTLTDEVVHFLAKVETHNHPTAVSPYPGAATGSGGEIRDEGAVGRGSKPKAGLSGFSVSDLCIPEGKQPWELDIGRPPHIASALDIMIEAPIGSASFNNEFGRPAIGGYFRTLTTSVINSAGKREYRGFHKPIMLAGGVGNVRPQFALKNKAIVPGSHLIVLGGPSMLIGLGGGAASSVASGVGSADLDFASVQRGNPEMERRAQMVIDGCTALGDSNPILSIHDVGAGGLSNALPELVHDNGLGAKFELRDIPNAEPGMSPMEIWCNEAQERYVLAVSPEDLPIFEKIADRERCPYGVVGIATTEQRLVLTDRLQSTVPIDLDMSTLFSKPPKMSRIATTKSLKLPEFDSSLASYYTTTTTAATNVLTDAIDRVLHLPAVGSKSFLITIGDRTVTGLVARDQMVGPWQTPVADVSVTTTSYWEGSTTGEAFSVGEKPNLAIISPRASAQMAVAESLLNLVAANIAKLPHVKLSANWMAAPAHEGEGANLYEAVEAIGLELCPALGIGIPVGKDSMSMKMKWSTPKSKEPVEVTAPVSLVVTAFSPVENVHKTWTPTLVRTYEESRDDSQIILVDLAGGKKRLGGSALAQVYGQVGNSCPQVNDPLILKAFVEACRDLHQENLVLAYHDRSEGGLLTTLIEMAFAGRVGLDITLQREDQVIPTLFNEELGAVFQVENHKVEKFYSILASHGIQDVRSVALVRSSKDQQITISQDGKMLYSNTRASLQQAWTYTSYKMQRLRDNPKTTDQEYAAILDNSDPGLQYRLSFDIKSSASLDSGTFNKLPKVAILREQGVNGHAEMAYAFMSAGFRPIDVHMTDILSNRVDLDEFTGLAACGGFSYGDVLGAGAGWAKSVLYHQKVRQKFARFFGERKDTFALGVCNGCQFFSRLRELIPGAEHWPSFERNASEQYEARVCMLEVVDEAKQPCVFFEGMRGSKLPVAVAHGEGRAVFASKESRHLLQNGQANGGCGSLVGVRYVDNYGTATERYPFNPNGSIDAIAGVRSPDGRVLAMMPHPERVILKQANSYIPDEMKSPEWGYYGPWIRMFQNARRWVS